MASQTFTTPGDFTFTVPAFGVTAVNVLVIGAGGAGYDGGLATPGGGGGGGAIVGMTGYNVTPGATINGHVGNGGGASGFDGELSWFVDQSTFLADYGKAGSALAGGAAGSNINSIVPGGGLRGSGGLGASPGATDGGGGGGGGSLSGDGFNGSGSSGGKGGDPTYGGSGGVAGATPNGGDAGFLNSGGGGGAGGTSDGVSTIYAAGNGGHWGAGGGGSSLTDDVVGLGIAGPVQISWTYATPAPTSCTSSDGATGQTQSVTISDGGNHTFSPGCTVTFGGAPATSVVVADDSTITCVTPTHAAGAVNVVVTNADGTIGTLTNGYTYHDPTITSVRPSGGSVAGGTAVTITGQYFTGVANVQFGTSTQSTISVDSDTQITCNSPAHAAVGVVDVVAYVNAGSSTTYTNGFTYFSTGGSGGLLKPGNMTGGMQQS